MSYIYRLVEPSPDPARDEALLQTVLEIDHEGPKPHSLAINFKEVDRGVTPVSLAEEERDPDWRDKPVKERTALYWKEGKAEAKRELQEVWASFKNDPLDPVRSYFKNFVVTGIGLFLEGWVIFSISNVSTLFKQSYKHCWGTMKPIHCNNTWLQATTYLQLVGILLGQLFFGFCGDWIGRKRSMLADMMVVLLGVIMLTVSNGTTEQGWVVMYGLSQLVFGFGIGKLFSLPASWMWITLHVLMTEFSEDAERINMSSLSQAPAPAGGEYPATSTRATEEESEEDRARSQRHRGRKVMLAYTMQGWGQFFNLGTLLILLLIFNSSGNPPYSHAAAGATWRVSFGLLIPVVLYFLYYRVFVLKELKALDEIKRQNSVKGYDWKSFRLLFSHFWHRLLGSGGIWFCNDWYFYGNGVFRSTFVGILLGPKAGVETNWLWSFLNAGIQLFGYYAAALSVDFRPWGRRRMTTFSFLMIFAIFLSCYIAYDSLVKKEHVQWFQFLYYFSSFWGLFGSHTTSFLLSAEMYPTAVRSTSHGLSAAMGKVGSIGVVVWFNYVSTRTKFLITFPVAFLGAVLTWVFIADNTGLDLAEQDLRWQFIRAGKPESYHGPAVHPRHLSLWEKYVLKIHHQYNPELHAKQSSLIRESFQKKLREGKTPSTGAHLREIAEESPLVTGANGKA